MSVKIGIGFGGWPFPTADPDHLWEYTDLCETLGVDSLWLSDRVVSDAMNVEPVVALSFIAARTTNLKFGTSVLALPLRNPTVLAQGDSDAGLSFGRALSARRRTRYGRRERSSRRAGASKRQRGRVTDEAVEVMRLLWSRDSVTFRGRYFNLTDVHLSAQAGPEGAAAYLDRRAQPACYHAHRQDRRRLAGVPRPRLGRLPTASPRSRRWRRSSETRSRTTTTARFSASASPIPTKRHARQRSRTC